VKPQRDEQEAGDAQEEGSEDRHASAARR